MDEGRWIMKAGKDRRWDVGRFRSWEVEKTDGWMDEHRTSNIE